MSTALVSRNTSRLHGQMKVTQPLGTFVEDQFWTERDPANAASADQASAAFVQDEVRPFSSPPPGPADGAASAAPARQNTLAYVRPVPSGWRPDERLHPERQAAVCEQLYRLSVEGCFVIAIVGVPEALEQKSQVAAELALALAESRHLRVLLVDADLQAPRLHRLMNVDMPIAAGFSQQLRARVEDDDEQRWLVVACGDSLHVLVEGMMRSPGLALSRPFGAAVRQLRKRYDFIVIDAPTASLQSDSAALDASTDGVAFVCSKDGSKSLAQMQSLFGEKKLRTIVTTP